MSDFFFCGVGSSRKISIYGRIAWNEGELGHFADLISGVAY